MAGAAAKKTPDLAVMLGVGVPKPKGKGDAEPDMMDEEEPAEGEGEELPPGFLSAAEEMGSSEPGSEPWARALYRAIESCKGGM